MKVLEQKLRTVTVFTVLKEFVVNESLRQGGVLSQVLFYLVMGDVIKKDKS